MYTLAMLKVAQEAEWLKADGSFSNTILQFRVQAALRYLSVSSADYILAMDISPADVTTELVEHAAEDAGAVEHAVEDAGAVEHAAEDAGAKNMQNKAEEMVAELLKSISSGGKTYPAA